MSALEGVRAWLKVNEDDEDDVSVSEDQNWRSDAVLTIGDLRRVEAEVRAEALRAAAEAMLVARDALPSGMDASEKVHGRRRGLEDAGRKLRAMAKEAAS